MDVEILVKLCLSNNTIYSGPVFVILQVLPGN